MTTEAVMTRKTGMPNSAKGHLWDKFNFNDDDHDNNNDSGRDEDGDDGHGRAPLNAAG